MCSQSTQRQEVTLPDPKPLMELSTAYWKSRAFLSALKLGVFELLGDGEKMVDEIATALQANSRSTLLLLNSCVALGLIEKRADGKFCNAVISQTYLVPDSRSYLGNSFLYCDDLYEPWGHLEEAVRNGRPAVEAEIYLGEDIEKTRHFVYGMHNRALGIGSALVGLVNVTGCRRMLDVGGGPGTYSALFASQHPQLHSTVLDLPDIVAIATEIVASMGMAKQVDFMAGSYLETEFPTNNDAILMSGIFHRETSDACQELIKKSAAALDDNGLLIVSDVLADAGNTGPEFATLFGLNMMLSAENGGVHSDADVRAWMALAGFRSITCRHFPPPMPHRVVTGINQKRAP